MSRLTESVCHCARALPWIGSAVLLALVTPAAASTGANTATVAKAKSSSQAVGQAAGKPRTAPRVTTETETAAFRLKPAALASLAMPPLDVSRFAFTAPGRVASSKVSQVERGFSFTPSGSTDRKALSVGVTTRAIASAPAAGLSRAAAAPVDAGIGPSGYGVDVALGWKGFSVSGGVAKFDAGLGSGGDKEAADIGLSYASRNWKTGIHATAERGSSLVAAPGAETERFALEAGGAMALSPALSVGGSVRYRLAPLNPTPIDPTKDDRAVFLGGALAF